MSDMIADIPSVPGRGVSGAELGAGVQTGFGGPFGGAEVQLFDSARAGEGSGTPGEVVSVSADGVVVQSGGGRILLKRVRPAGGGKIPASEWAAQAGIAAGARLGS
jgi:methionyl-tRNA formyltransferase